MRADTPISSGLSGESVMRMVSLLRTRCYLSVAVALVWTRMPARIGSSDAPALAHEEDRRAAADVF
jgi:hypothetical protein